jgi:hypothetical protein
VPGWDRFNDEHRRLICVVVSDSDHTKGSSAYLAVGVVSSRHWHHSALSVAWFIGAAAASS